MDVAGRDDHVLPGRSREAAADAEAFLQLLALLDVLAQLADRRSRVGAYRLSQLLILGGGERGQLLRMSGNALDCVQRIAHRARLQRATPPIGVAHVQDLPRLELLPYQSRCAR